MQLEYNAYWGKPTCNENNGLSSSIQHKTHILKLLINQREFREYAEEFPKLLDEVETYVL